MDIQTGRKRFLRPCSISRLRKCSACTSSSHHSFLVLPSDHPAQFNMNGPWCLRAPSARHSLHRVILGIHDCRFVPVAAAKPDVVIARVAGFDTAVYGLPSRGVFPILFVTSNGRTMIATTKLSQFITGRYEPVDAWSPIWTRIIEWAAGVQSIPALRWTPDVHPAYASTARLPDSADTDAVIRSGTWFQRSRMLVDSRWSYRLDDAAAFPDRVAPAPSLDLPPGDGRAGLLEGFSSVIHVDGSQPVRWWLRADCMGEASFALALAGLADPKLGGSTIARNLNDFVYLNSILQGGSRADPTDPSFGLLGWNTTPKYSGDLNGFDVFYGDDNARAILGTIGASAVLGGARWNESVARCILANYRTTGKYGFRGKRIDQPQLAAHGWKHYFASETVNYAPHYEAYLWAVYLWAYERTGYRPFLDRTATAIRMTIHAYPDEWHWTNGLQQERARMLLPLAWLVRVEDTPEHRAWLATIARDLLAAQDSSGALREEIGSAGKGDYGPPKSNDAYGASEAPLIQENGDPLTDLLYTANFAFLGLHEAAAATHDANYRTAEDRLAEFLCRVQVRSDRHPELDGAWYRAFDFRRWDYWASNADSGWGAWSVETGWTQSWITSVLQLRRMKTSYWELTRSSQIATRLKALLPVMLGSSN